MKIKEIKKTIKLLSGLHIGGGDDTMKIGGIDNQVIKDINTGEPFIPGSSIKGKMRSLLEWYFGLVNLNRPENLKGEPFSSKCIWDKDGNFVDPAFNDKKLLENAENILKLFGDKEGKYGITRISIGDAFITDNIREKYKNGEINLFEAKYENVIDRCKGTAKHPRQTERVPAGIEFKVSIRYKVLHGDNEEKFLEIIEKGIELIEKDYLGGNGSRGYGRVKFEKSE